MILKKLPKLYKGLHQCKRCNSLYRDAGKTSKICPKCRLPNGSKKNICLKKIK
jgi:hypothetical protein